MRAFILLGAIIIAGAFIAAGVQAAGFTAARAFCLGMFWMIAVSLVINSLPARRA